MSLSGKIEFPILEEFYFNEINRHLEIVLFTIFQKLDISDRSISKSKSFHHQSWNYSLQYSAMS